MTLLTRARVAASNDLPTKDVEVPEWGGSVRIRKMTAKDRDLFDQAMMAAARDADEAGEEFRPDCVRALYAVSCVVDENGERLFSPDDVEMLNGKSASALDRIYQEIVALNGIAPDAVEQAAKN